MSEDRRCWTSVDAGRIVLRFYAFFLLYGKLLSMTDV